VNGLENRIDVGGIERLLQETGRPGHARAASASSRVELISTTSILECCRRSCETSSMPFSPGMLSSRKTRSNLPAPICWSVLTPAVASEMSSGNRQLARILRTMPRTVDESSTTRTRLGTLSRVQASISAWAAGISAGLTAMASTEPAAAPSAGAAPVGASRTTDGELRAARAALATSAKSRSAMAQSRSATSTFPSASARLRPWPHGRNRPE
jgi:hypothetical protein